MTSAAQPIILERLSSSWNMPPQERPNDAPPVWLYRDRTVPAAAIYEALLREFRDTEISAAITDFLASIAAKYERDAVPAQDELFLADCCIQLISQVDRLRLEKELIVRIIRVFPTPGWYHEVPALVARYLTKSELLRTLLEGLVRPPHPYVVMNCLAAVRHYSKAARKDPEPHALVAVIDELRKKVNELSRSGDAETVKFAGLAARHLDRLEQEQAPPLS